MKMYWYGITHIYDWHLEEPLKQHTQQNRFDMNIYFKTSVLTEIVIFKSVVLLAHICPIRTVKPVLSCTITNF